MKVIILGAGQVGTSLAKNLLVEHDVSLIDSDSEKLRIIQNKFDVRTICGSGAHPHILEDAGAQDADMLIAVTSSDEINIVACQMAYSLFKTPTKVARIRNKSYLRYPKIFDNDHIPIDIIINPSDLVTRRLLRIVENPGSFQVLDFAKSTLQIIGTSISPDSVVAGISVSGFRRNLPDIDARIMTIIRHGNAISFSAETTLKVNDDVFFIAHSEHVPAILSLIRPRQRRIKRVLIAGGGNIGTGLAKSLESDYLVKLIENNFVQCHKTAENLDDTVVLFGDAADAELLETENIDEIDLFCSVTNDDEANIMSAMLAKKMGAANTMALINSLSYAALINDGDSIDVALSPQKITIGVILTYLRKGDFINIYAYNSGLCEAMEVVVHGDEENSAVIGKSIKSLHLPQAVKVGAIIKGNTTIIAHDDSVIEKGDHVILAISDLSYIKTVEKLFEVSPSFI
jgi:trk system potassium uptake protein TrkA